MSRRHFINSLDVLNIQGLTVPQMFIFLSLIFLYDATYGQKFNSFFSRFKFQFRYNMRFPFKISSSLWYPGNQINVVFIGSKCRLYWSQMSSLLLETINNSILRMEDCCSFKFLLLTWIIPVQVFISIFCLFVCLLVCIQ